MSGSFRKIDYSLRPAKHAERRMLAEVFRRLWPFQTVDEYVYVGFGSVWFSDFLLFHRSLGINEMISIEKSSGARQRFESNKPFRTIRLDFRESSLVLPELDWTKRHIIWLDYDDAISKSVLFDVSSVANRAKSGTLLAVTVQCHQAREVGEAQAEPDGPNALVRFRDRFGPALVSSDIFEEDLGGWPFGKISRGMLKAEIESALVVRNASAEAAQTFKFHPICEIEYEDGAKMTTIVGVFSSVADEDILSRCGFSRLDFLHGGSIVRRIRVPVLTVREIRYLEQQLPARDLSNLALGAIPPGEAYSYSDLYRYLPNFAVLET